MPYTLAMAADQEPKIAEDGVQEVPLTIARPLLTRLIEQAREDGLASALTVRGRRRAYVVTPDFYEQAEGCAETLRQARAAVKGDRSLADTLRVHYPELHQALTSSES